MDTIYKRIEELLAFNPALTQAKVKAYLLLDDWKQKDIDAAVKEVMGRAKAPSFIDGYYAFISTGQRTTLEASAYVMGEDGHPETSTNTKKHLRHYLNINDLARQVYQNVSGNTQQDEEPQPQPKASAEGPEKDDPVKQAWSDLHSELRRQRPRKTKIHPDKVSHLGDEELTAAYTKAFQDLNKGPRASRKAA